MPDAEGVPDIVISFDDQDALTPDGKPVAEPIPVAPVVEWVISVNAVLIHNVGELDPEPTVFNITVDQEVELQLLNQATFEVG